jgi:hypothetical protein
VMLAGSTPLLVEFLFAIRPNDTTTRYIDLDFRLPLKFPLRWVGLYIRSRG